MNMHLLLTASLRRGLTLVVDGGKLTGDRFERLEVDLGGDLAAAIFWWHALVSQKARDTLQGQRTYP